MDVKIKLMDNGKLPQFMHRGDACCDCYSAEETVIKAGERKLVKLGFAIQLPEGYEAVVRPRSGLSKKGIDICIGTVDSSYTGEVMANVVNNSDDFFAIHFGDRICQLAIRKTEVIDFVTVEKLDETERGSNGFGSSGIN